METPDNKTSIYGEIDYLWEAMQHAQEESSRAKEVFTASRRESETLKSRVAHLETAVNGGSKREAALKAEIQALTSAIARDAETLKQALTASDTAARLQETVNELEGRLAADSAVLELKEDSLNALRECLKGAADRSTEKEAAITALTFKLKGLSSLPEIAAVLKKEGAALNKDGAALNKDGAAVGREPSVFEDLAGRLEALKAGNEEISGGLAAAKAENISLAEKNRVLSEDRGRRTEELEALTRRTEALAAEVKAAQTRLDLSEEEKTALKKELRELSDAREDLKTDLYSSRTASTRNARDIAIRDEEILRLKTTISDTGIKLDESKQNFAGAVKQVFELQNTLSGLRRSLTESRESGEELSRALEQKQAELEKFNVAIRGTSLALQQERESAKRATGKIKVLEAEMDNLKARLAKTEDYAARLLRVVEERDKYISGLNKELDQITALELEVSQLKRHNLKFTGLVRQEQSEFTDKLVKNLAKTAGDLKLLNVRLPAEQQRQLSQPLKNLYGALNLMKGWQTYIDEGEVEKADTDLRQLVSEAAARWEKAFKQKKLGFAAYLAAPAAVARVNAEKVKTALYQLVKNAYENVTAGGSLKIVFELSEDRSAAVIKLDDTGPGLPKEVADRLYTPFNTLKKDHIGIGLAMAARVAEQHGGRLTVRNKKDRGLLVEFTLPLSDSFGQP